MIGLAAVFLMAAAPAPVRKPARGAVVRPSSLPLIELQGDFRGPRIIHDRTASEIEAIRTGKEPKGWHNPGLTVSEHIMNTHYELGLEQDRPGAPYRAYLSKLIVEFGYTKLEVYVAREYAKGTCEYNQVLKHEMEHVNIHAATYRKYKRLLKGALEASGRLPTRKKPLYVKNPDQAQVQVDRLVKGITNPLYDRFGAELLRAQAKIDTPANYQAIQRKCGQWR